MSQRRGWLSLHPEVRSYPLQSIARKLLDFSASLIPDSLGFFSLLSRAHMNMNLDETPTTTCALQDLQHDAKARQHVPDASLMPRTAARLSLRLYSLILSLTASVSAGETAAASPLA